MDQIPTLYHEGLRTMSDQVDSASNVIKMAVKFAGGEGEKFQIFISDQSGPLPSATCPGGSTKLSSTTHHANQKYM